MTRTGKTTIPDHDHDNAATDAAAATAIATAIAAHETKYHATPPPVTPGAVTPPAGVDLQTWLMGLPSGAIADLAGGTYTVAAGQIRLSGKRNLTIQNGTVTFSKVLTGSSAGAWLLDQQAGGITFRNIVSIGAATGAPGVAESNHGFQAQGCQGLVIDGCTTSHFGGDGLYSGGYVNPTWTHDLTLTNSTFTLCGRMGVGVADGLTNFVIDGCTFDQFGWYATLDIEPNGVPVGVPAGSAHFENGKFTNNRIGRGNSAKLTFVVSTASNQNQAAPIVSGIVVTGNRTMYADTPWNPSISGWSSAVSMSNNQ